MFSSGFWWFYGSFIVIFGFSYFFGPSRGFFLGFLLGICIAQDWKRAMSEQKERSAA